MWQRERGACGGFKEGAAPWVHKGALSVRLIAACKAGWWRHGQASAVVAQMQSTVTPRLTVCHWSGTARVNRALSVSPALISCSPGMGPALSALARGCSCHAGGSTRDSLWRRPPRPRCTPPPLAGPGGPGCLQAAAPQAACIQQQAACIERHAPVSLPSPTRAGQRCDPHTCRESTPRPPRSCRRASPLQAP